MLAKSCLPGTAHKFIWSKHFHFQMRTPKHFVHSYFAYLKILSFPLESTLKKKLTRCFWKMWNHVWWTHFWLNNTLILMEMRKIPMGTVRNFRSGKHLHFYHNFYRVILIEFDERENVLTKIGSRGSVWMGKSFFGRTIDYFQYSKKQENCNFRNALNYYCGFHEGRIFRFLSMAQWHIRR